MKKLKSFLFFLFFFPSFVFAIFNPEFAEKFYQFFQKIFDLLFTLALFLTVIFLVWAGFNFITAGGNPEKVEKGKRIILYCLIGFLVAILSKGTTLFLAQKLGVKVEKWYQKKEQAEYFPADLPNQFLGVDVMPISGEKVPPPP